VEIDVDVDLWSLGCWVLTKTRMSRAALELLAERGPQLGRALVHMVVPSRHQNMKELRPGSAEQGRGHDGWVPCLADDPDYCAEVARFLRRAVI
jgi:hypothetical protein